MSASIEPTMRPRTLAALWLTVLLALTAAVLSGYLWYQSMQLHRQGYQIGMMLCPETDLVSCREVLLSRYAEWLHIPLAAVGTANYVVLLAATAGLLIATGAGRRRLLWTISLAAAALGTGSGIWLLWVQLFRLHKICLICDVVHLCGLLSLILLVRLRPVSRTMGGYALAYTGAMALAAAGLITLFLGQTLVQPDIKPGTVVAASQPATLTSQPAGTEVAATQTQPANVFIVRDTHGVQMATIDLEQAIILGDPTSERTLIELMDFSCHECRHEAGLIQDLQTKYPGWFRVIVLLYPASHDCNKYTPSMRPHVCEIARAALAVRKYAPENFKAVYDMFFRLQGPNLTGGLAWQIVREMAQVDEATLDAWQADPYLLETIRYHCDLGTQLQGDIPRPGLPTLYANGMVYCGADDTAGNLQTRIAGMIGPPPVPPPADATKP